MKIVKNREHPMFLKGDFPNILTLGIKSFWTIKFTPWCCQTTFKQSPIHSQDMAHTDALHWQCRKLALVFYREIENEGARCSFFSMFLSLSLSLGSSTCCTTSPEVSVLSHSGDNTSSLFFFSNQGGGIWFLYALISGQHSLLYFIPPGYFLIFPLPAFQY